MSSSTVDTSIPSATQVRVNEDALSVDLSDGRSITVPLAWFPRLSHGSQGERDNWRLIAGGRGIHWNDLDEDISVEGLLAGKSSGESQISFKKWLQDRPANKEQESLPRVTTYDKVQIPKSVHPGIREHFIRAVLYSSLGKKMDDVADRFRLMMAAVYSCQAMTELMLDRADRKELTIDRTDLKNVLAQELPFFRLIERIRIHDFHRYWIIPPDLRVAMRVGLGPIKLTANQGSAILQQTSEGPLMTITGKSTIKGNRPLFSADGTFYDEDSGVSVEIDKIVADNLTAIPAAIAKFESLLNDKGRIAYPTPELFPHLYGET